MRFFDVVVDGKDCTIHVPIKGQFDYDAQELAEKFAYSDSIFGVDVESTHLTDLGVFDPEWRMRLIQFGTRTEAWVFDVTDPIQFRFVEWFLGGDKKFVSHTNIDPMAINQTFGIDLSAEGKSVDTHVMACLLTPGETNDHSLKHLSELYIDDTLRFAEQNLYARFKELAPVGHRAGNNYKLWGWDNISSDDDDYVIYAGLDAIHVRILLDCLAVQLQFQGELSRREQKIQRICTGITQRGMRLDIPYTEKLLAELSGEMNEATTLLEAEWGFPARSPKRAQWFLDQGVKFEKWTAPTDRNPKGMPVLDKNTIPVLADKYQDGVVGWAFALMLEVSKLSNLVANLKKMLSCVDANGMVHPTYKILQAVTGRMSATNPAIQTLKKKDTRLRQCFISREGFVLVSADFAQVEIRIAAGVSKDPNLTEAILGGLDLHDYTAELIFGPGFTETQRQLCKTINFAVQYGAGAEKIALQTGVSVAVAKDAIKRWRKAYPQLARYLREIQYESVVVNDWGRRTPRDPKRAYANGNYMIQGSGRDILADAILELDRRGWADNIWAVIHDEIVLEVPISVAELSSLHLEESMTMTYRGIPIVADAEVIGTKWGLKPGTTTDAMVSA